MFLVSRKVKWKKVKNKKEKEKKTERGSRLPVIT
jgi:hypothetical protein